MSFLAPFWLLLGGAVAVPLLIHLLRRRIGVRVEFPAARYLARAEQEHSRSLRLRNLLLMLLRVLVVLALALAAARPVTRWVGAGHAPTALAVVVDNSMSTGAVIDGRPVFDRIRAAARDLLAASAAGDRLWLVTADGRVRGGTAGTLTAELDRLEPLAGAGDLQRAVTRAAAAVRSAGLEARQVAVLTDGQRSSWTATYDVGEAQVLLWTAQGSPPVNRAVREADARPQRWTPRGAVLARFLARDSATYRVVLGERTLSRGTAAPDEEVTVQAAPPERGWVAGRIELEPDELAADNARHFAVWIGPAPGVTVMAGAGPFVASAADVLRGNQRITTGRDIVVGAADEVTSLPALIVPPNDAVRLGAANRALERLGVPWRFGAARRAQEGVRGEEVGDVAISTRYALQAQPGAVAETLAAVGRDPWIVSGPRYVIVASPLVPEATTFPVRASFVPWMARMLDERLVGEPGQVLTAVPGAELPRPRWAEALVAADGTGNRETLDDTIAVPARPGVYFFERGGRRVGALVVDAEPDESVLARATNEELEGRFRATRVVAAPERENWPAFAFQAASRRSLVQPLLILALVLLALETLLARAGTPRVA